MCCCLSTTYYNSSIYLPSSSAKKDLKKKQQSGDIYHQKTLLGIFLEFSRSKEKLKECFKIDDLMLAFQIVVLNLKQPQQQDFNWLGPSFLSLDFLKKYKSIFWKISDAHMIIHQFFESTTHPNSIKPFPTLFYSPVVCASCLKNKTEKQQQIIISDFSKLS